MHPWHSTYKKLRDNSDTALPLEKKPTQRGDCFLRNVHITLTASGLYNKNLQLLIIKCGKALSCYEQELGKVLSAQEQIIMKLYKEDIKTLARKIAILAMADGLAVGDATQIELATDTSDILCENAMKKWLRN